MIQPAREAAKAKNTGAKVTTLQASRVPRQFRPAKAAAVIIEAVNSSK